MSNEDVPGEKSTTSPGRLCCRAWTTASLSVCATEHGATFDQLCKIRSAISPINTACLTLSRIKSLIASNPKPLSFPPAIKTTGSGCDSRALTRASRFVAFESLIKTTPAISPTFSHRCGRSRYSVSPHLAFSQGTCKAYAVPSAAIRFSAL